MGIKNKLFLIVPAPWQQKCRRLWKPPHKRLAMQTHKKPVTMTATLLQVPKKYTIFSAANLLLAIIMLKPSNKRWLFCRRLASKILAWLLFTCWRWKRGAVRSLHLESFFKLIKVLSSQEVGTQTSGGISWNAVIVLCAMPQKLHVLFNLNCCFCCSRLCVTSQSLAFARWLSNAFRLKCCWELAQVISSSSSSSSS